MYELRPLEEGPGNVGGYGKCLLVGAGGRMFLDTR